MALAYENVNLAVDTQVLKNCGREYADIAKKLRTMVDKLEKSLNELTDDKTGWNTPAGKKFQIMVDTNWSKNIEKYADLLETLNTILKYAAKQYENLIEDHIEKTKL